MLLWIKVPDFKPKMMAKMVITRPIKCSCGVTIALRNKLAGARGHSYHIMQVPHPSMQTRLSYERVGQTDRRLFSFTYIVD